MAGTGNLTLNNNSVLTSGITLTNGANNTGSITNSGTGTGSTLIGVIGTNVTGGVIQNGTGTLAMNGLNTFTSGLSVIKGTVSSSQNGTTGFGNGAISLGNTAGGNSDNATILYTGTSTAVANEITVNAGSSGILAIQGNTATANAFTGNITLNNAVTLANLTAAKTTTFSGTITGSSAINIGNTGITNNGTVSLTGANSSSFSGATTVNGGTLNFTSGALGSGNITLAGGTLQYAAAANTQDVGSRLRTSGANALKIDVNNNAVVFASPLTDASLTQGLTLTSTAAGGSLTLTGANTYTGLTTVTSGTLKLASAGGTIASGNNLTTAAAGTFDINGNSQTLGALVNAGNVTNSGAGTPTLTITSPTASSGAGSITGALDLLITNNTVAITTAIGTANNAGTITNSGTGTGTTTITTVGTNVTSITENSTTSALTLTNLNVNSGGTTLTNTAGTKILTVTNSVSGTGNLVLNNNSVLASGITLAGGANNIGSITNSGTNSTGTTTISGTIDTNVTGGVIQNGAGTLILSGVNTFTGNTTISGGTLQATKNAALNTTGTVSVSNAGSMLAVNYGGVSDYTDVEVVTLLGKTSFATSTTAFGFNTANGNGTYGNNLTMASGLTKLGANTLSLTGANTYTGGTTINSGTLEIGGAGTLGGGSYADNIANSGTINFNTTANHTLSGNVSGTGAFKQSGTGTLTLTGTNTYTGATTIGTGAGALILSGSGVLNSGNYSGLITNNSALVYDSSADQTLGGIISGAGSITKNGTSTLRLSAANTFSGGVTLNSGTLDLVSNTTMLGNGTTSVFTINGGALDTSTGTARTLTNSQVWNGDFQYLGTGGVQIVFSGPVTLGGNRVVTVSNTLSALSETGIIGDGGNVYGITKEGAGTLSIGGGASNTYTGNTTVNAGNLYLASSNKLADSSNIVVNGGRMDLTNAAGTVETVANVTVTGGYISGTGNGTLNRLTATNGFNFQNADNTISVNLGGGNITKTTGGTVTLSGNNTNTGTLTVDGGTLILSKSASLYSGSNASWTKSNITVNNGGTLAFNVVGTGEFTTGDFATLVTNLTGDVSTGGFKAGSAIGIGGTASNISAIIADTTGTGGGAIGLYKYSAVVTTLTGNNTYTGDTTISAGTLSLGTGGRLGGGNYAGNIINNGVLSVAMGGSSSQTLSGVISGSGTLTNGGNASQTITLSGNNSYSGGSTLSTSLFVLGHKNALGAGDVAIGTGQSPSFSAGIDLSGGNAIGNNVAMNAGFNIVGSNNLTLSGILTLDNNRTIAVSNTAETILSGPIHLSNGVTSGNLSLTASPGSGPLTVSGLIDEGAAPQGVKFSLTTGAVIKLTNVGNSYTGATEGTGTATGNLEVSKLANGGSVSSIGASTSDASNLILSLGSTLRYVGSGDSTDRLFTVSGASGGINSSGSGALNFTNNGSIAYGAAGTARTLTLTGTNTDANSFASVIGDNGAGLGALTKSGAGTWVVSGNNSYTGTTTISGGVLEITTLADVGSNSNIGANGSISINGGALKYTGAGSSTNRTVAMGATGLATIDASGIGAVAFTSATSFGAAGSTLTLTGTNTGNNTFGHMIGTTTNLAKTGSGTWVLSNANTTQGNVTVTAGTLVISGTGSINGSTGIASASGSSAKLKYDSSVAMSRNVTVTSGGTFAYNSSGNYTGTLTLTDGNLGGTNWNGTKLGGLTIGANQTISPGNSVGNATTTTQTWASGGSYDWEINKADGAAGIVSGGWDLLTLSGALTLSATNVTPFSINIFSLGLDNLTGPATGFSSGLSYNWLIADAGSAISGFSANKFTLDVSGFQNAFTGSFGIELGNTGSLVGIGDTSQLYVTYTAIPEPSTWALLAFSLTTVMVLRRRRRD